MLHPRTSVLLVSMSVVLASLAGWSRIAGLLDRSKPTRVESPWSPQTLGGRLPGKPLSRVQLANVITAYCVSIGRTIPAVAPGSLQTGGMQPEDMDLPYRAPCWMWKGSGVVIEVADGSGIVVNYNDGGPYAPKRPLAEAAILQRVTLVVKSAGVYPYLAGHPVRQPGHEGQTDDWTYFWPTKDGSSNLNGVVINFSSSGDLLYMKVNCWKKGDIATS